MRQEVTLTIRTEDLPEALLLRLSGEVDLQNVNTLADALRPVTRERRHVILDCSALQYIDSTGFHLLYATRQDLARYGRMMIIASPPPELHRAFEIIMLGKRIPCVASVEEARRILKS